MQRDISDSCPYKPMDSAESDVTVILVLLAGWDRAAEEEAGAAEVFYCCFKWLEKKISQASYKLNLSFVDLCPEMFMAP
ncbi:hypothetical protein Y1Q_0019764 [Alligator mississippiensis]|uniref:Uncharacterized protein n=1 Tax=Alligator mississippiensis TaxID=8496 RepID=A0A151PEZ1_ALLMI|nr:hypothetical protein Y1Q_0019764 [Alligator mississippiensis]